MSKELQEDSTRIEQSPIFLLGVGAQKAGTTWFQNYLANRPDADFGFAKEYHIWDAIEGPLGAPFLENATRGAISRLEKGSEKWVGSDAIRTLSFINDPETYFDYFARLLRSPGIHITGDVTPNYSWLSRETLARIRDGFASRGVAVRLVFLMRDPVDRLQSMMRFGAKRAGRLSSPEEEIERMRNAVGQPWESLRGDYASTITAADDVFGEQVYYGFFEDLFNDESIQSICGFLGLEPSKAQFDVRQNASSSDYKLPPDKRLPSDIRLEIARHFSDRYAFCSSYFGADRINSLWPSAQLL